MSERFYHPEIAISELVNISGPEANHIAKVMRLAVGEHIRVFDGSGREFECEIVELNKKTVSLKKIDSIDDDRELRFLLHIAVTLPKSDRQRFLFEKLTELGVSDVTLLNTRRSVAKATPSNIDKFNRYVIEASKQCGRNRLMNIHPGCQLAEFLERNRRQPDTNNLRLIADPAGNAGLTLNDHSDVLIIIGPEGGLTEDEVETCKNAGFKAVKMGQRILRTEPPQLQWLRSFQ